MYKKWIVIFTLCALILPGAAYAQKIPEPAGWVMDLANVISADYEAKLSSLIQELEEKTSVEIAVLTVESIAPYDEKEYARLVFDKWKIGKEGKDNGVLVLLAIKERFWRIEVGYGLEGTLPDGLCGEIGRKYMVPDFKVAEYGKGVYRGVLKITDVIGNAYGVKVGQAGSWYEVNEAVQREVSENISFILFVLFLLFLFLPIILANWNNRRNGYSGRYYGGGSYGGGYGGGSFGGGGFGGFGGGMGGGGGAGGRF